MTKSIDTLLGETHHKPTPEQVEDICAQLLSVAGVPVPSEYVDFLRYCGGGDCVHGAFNTSNYAWNGDELSCLCGITTNDRLSNITNWIRDFGFYASRGMLPIGWTVYGALVMFCVHSRSVHIVAASWDDTFDGQVKRVADSMEQWWNTCVKHPR